MTDSTDPPLSRVTAQGVPDQSPRKALGTSGKIAGGTLLSRITGLVRVWVTFAVLGETVLADTYNSANSTPNLIYELLLGGVLTATVVPLFVDLHAHDDLEGTRAVLSIAVVALVALSGVAVLAAQPLARLLSIQVGTADRDAAVALGTALIRCFAAQMLGYGFTALAAAALNARGRFAAAAYAPVINNVVVCAVLLTVRARRPALDTPGGLDAVDGDIALTLALGLGTTAGVLATALVLVPALVRARVPLRPTWAPRHPAVGRLVRHSGWTIGYVVANQLALLVVMIVARDTDGALTAYQLAFVFFQLPHGLFAVSIMTAWLPDLAARASRGDIEGMRARFDAGLGALLALMIPAAAGYLALSVPIVDTFLTTGDAVPTNVAAALSGFALGLVPFSVYLFALRGFYALGDTRTPCLINAFENALNIAFAIPAFAWWGVRGLAGAYSAAYLIAAVVALVRLRVRIGPVGAVLRGRLAGWSTAGSFACGVLAWAFAHEVGSPGLAVMGGTALGIAIYSATVAAGARTELRATFGRDHPETRTTGVDV
jgi:putative peptidoglycan lipid II flippase